MKDFARLLIEYHKALGSEFKPDFDEVVFIESI